MGLSVEESDRFIHVACVFCDCYFNSFISKNRQDD